MAKLNENAAIGHCRVVNEARNAKNIQRGDVHRLHKDRLGDGKKPSIISFETIFYLLCPQGFILHNSDSKQFIDETRLRERLFIIVYLAVFINSIAEHIAR